MPAAAAGISQALFAGYDSIDPSNPGMQLETLFGRAIVGGLASDVTGGKFANGAVTAAFSYAFGEMARAGGMKGGGSGNGSPGGRVGDSRWMSEGEVSMSQEVFGDSIDYVKVKIFGRPYIGFQRRGYAMSPNGSIYFHPEDYMADFSTAGVGTRSWFMHEMTHVWQVQHGIRPTIRFKYNYAPLRTQSFTRWNTEQQGDIVSDYYRLMHGAAPQHGYHPPSAYRAVMPFTAPWSGRPGQ